MPLIRASVNPPMFTPPQYGLLSALDFPTPADPHWQLGVSWISMCSPSVTGFGNTTYDECVIITGSGNAPPGPPTKVDNVDLSVRGAQPFTVYSEFDCAPVGMDDMQRFAEDALTRVESWQVERAVWTGQAAGVSSVYPRLAANTIVLDTQSISLQTATITGGSFADPAQALSTLEGMLGDAYGGVGVIHIPLRALAVFDAWSLVKPSGPQLRTLAGNRVVVGAGYPGTGPNGAAAAAGQTWLYATSAMFAYRGSVIAPTSRESIDRSKNTVKLIAERTYVVGWECYQFAVLLTDLSVP